jgi:competence protein ComEA
MIISASTHEMTRETHVQAQSSNEIYVHISGETKKPGVYKIINGSRVVDLLKKAGGPTSEADLDNINLAEILTDGVKILIPSLKHNASALNSSTTPLTEDSKTFNLNTATASELDELPGIGPGFAKRIIEYRQSIGSFKQIEDLKEIPGLGEKKFEQIKGLVKVY